MRAYVALSRHRDGIALHYGREDFADGAELARTLGRERPKDMALDYADRTSNVGDRKAGNDKRGPDARTGAGQEVAKDQDRANTLRAMIAARRETPRPTAESVREAMAKAAKAIGISRGADRGAER